MAMDAMVTCFLVDDGVTRLPGYPVVGVGRGCPDRARWVMLI